MSILRGLSAYAVPDDSFFWTYDAIGQGLFGWRPPNGYPDDREAWSGTMPMMQRWRHCNWLFGWQVEGEGDEYERYRLKPEKQTPASLVTPIELVDFWSVRI